MPYSRTSATPAGRSPETAGPEACRLSPLDSADTAFRLLTTGPRPLALNPARLAPGLPDRQVPLGELRALLLHPSASAAARNKVWAELIRHAQTGGPAWVVGLAGVAMPGLRAIMCRATLASANLCSAKLADLDLPNTGITGADFSDASRTPGFQSTP